MYKKPRVVVALSGGVDSSVAALLLKKSGYQVYAAHMINWDKQVNELELDAQCETQTEDTEYAKEIAALLDIPITIYNFTSEYWTEVFHPYLTDLENNLLGNPDIDCNKKIKFGVFLKKIKEDFGEDVKIATGHYARITYDKEQKKYFLEPAVNRAKDQTYFLSKLSQEQLKEIIFPLGEIETKTEVRKIAREHAFPNWNKKSSAGICFVGRRKFRNFVMKFIGEREGEVVDVENQQLLGNHKGVHFYALNQRQGINISGKDEKYYVCGKDLKTSTLFVCKKSKKERHLVSSGCEVTDVFWSSGETPEKGASIYLKLKYTGDFVTGKLESVDCDKWKFSHSPCILSTPGQFVVFYSIDKKRCLGSGRYSKALFDL